MSTPTGKPNDGTSESTRYPNYMLGVLVLVYVFNFIDRQILSILNDEIKADLGLTDAQMGFLYGTAFAVFYALFGIPLGRLADVWTRRSLIAVSLSFWSAMTALSGMARNFGELAVARIGVGVGEAGATPAAFSMLSDSFPIARRATVLALYSSGIYLGAGAGLMIGGQIVGRWDAAFAAGGAPFDLRGWQVAYFVVGIPGLLLALWVRSLREPERGRMDGVTTPAEPHPFREFFRELCSVIPPVTVLQLWRLGATLRILLTNLASAVLVAGAAALLVVQTGDTAQWVALGVGIYAAFSWSQALRLRDPPSASLILGTPSLRWACLGFASMAFTGYGVGYWTAPFFLRVHELPIEQAGNILGGTAAASGWLGVAVGGVLADAWRRRNPRGRLYLAIIMAVAPAPLLFAMLYAENTTLALIVNFPLGVVSSMWIGCGASTVQDLVLPRMRASASAAYLLVITFIGLALGPYLLGHLSDVFQSLRPALLCALFANAVAVVCLAQAARHLVTDEATLRARASHAGEPELD